MADNISLRPKTKALLKAKRQSTVEVRGSASVVVHLELDLGEVRLKNGTAAKRFFQELAVSILAESGKLELVRHSCHCGVDLVVVTVQRLESQ